MKNHIFIFVFLIFALFSSLAFAQPLDTAIVVTDITSADFLVAKAAGEKAGIPVLVAANGEITELKEQLAELKPNTVVLVGGPAVIKPEAEAQLSADYAVLRLWGIERTGTAVEAAKFFWREGASCAVLVDDTKDSDKDTQLQKSAANLAAHKKCALIPIPKGTLPADVLATLKELGVKEIRFVGKEFKLEVKEKLKQFKVKETVGDEEEVENEVEQEIINETPKTKLKLVIVAAPHWKHVLGTGGQPSDEAVVKIVSDVNQSGALIELIKAKNISDVKVVGFPALAQQIAEQLNASGIAVKKVSGEKASEVAHKVLKEVLEKWREKRSDEEARKSVNREKIKERLLLALNETEAHLDAQWVRLDKLAAEGADTEKISVLKEFISLAKSRTEEIRRKILAGEFDDAEKLRFEVKNNFEKSKFRFRLEIKHRIEDELGEEEGTIEKFEVKIDTRDVEGRFADFRRRCVNITAVESLVQKAKSLRDAMKQAKDEGNHTKAAGIAREARRVAEQARALGDICSRRGEIPEKLRKIAEERAERAEKLREKVEEKLREEKIAEKFEVGFEAPSSANVNESFQVSWKVEGSAQITHTAVHYDYASHAGELGLEAGPAQSGYPSLTSEFAKGNFTIPNTFKAQITPDKAGTLYLRAHAIVDGKNYWTDEKKIEVKAKEQMQIVSYSIEANDTAFYMNNEKLSSITVKKGDKVKITFKVREGEVYFGGLAFRGGTVNTGDVKPGESKSAEFTADSSFTITSYWPASNVKKADLSVKVE